MKTINCDAALQLLPLHCDGELDLPTSLALEAHLATCPECAAAEHSRHGMSKAIKTAAPYHRMPDALRTKLAASLPQAASALIPMLLRRRNWTRWATPMAASLALAVGINALLIGQRQRSALTDEIVASHVRSLMVTHLDDVISTDRHTVKPWFAGKLDFSPPVHDLAAIGYPLAGGRIDYIGHRAVAALDYRRRQHVINLFVWPVADHAASTPQPSLRDGFNLEHWTVDGMDYWAVSDLNADELLGFAQQLRAAHASGPP